MKSGEPSMAPATDEEREDAAACEAVPPSTTIGTGSFFAVGCVVATVAVILIGILIAIIIR
ncbi:MAG TPA: hypothetical protein VGR16_11725 [Thermomicrobiales bacterium]|nr:hypothetical protein [Thermomicrobiales bacterium]